MVIFGIVGLNSERSSEMQMLAGVCYELLKMNKHEHLLRYHLADPGKTFCPLINTSILITNGHSQVPYKGLMALNTALDNIKFKRRGIHSLDGVRGLI